MRFIFIIFLFSTKLVVAQSVWRFPESLEMPEKTLFLLNPASIGTTYNRIDACTGYKGYTGFRNVLKYVYAGLFIRSDTNRHKTIHTIGFSAFSEQEGDFIRQNYFYGMYSLPIKISRNFILVSGGALGLASYSMAGTGSIAGGSDIGPDAKFGLIGKGKSFELGFSSGGLFNTRLVPLIDQNIVKRFYVFHLQKEFALNLFWKIKLLVLSRLKHNTLDYSFMAKSMFKDRFEGGLVFKPNTSLSFQFGISEFSISDKINLSLALAYSSIFKSKYFGSSDIFEIKLGYFLP